ncbi:hypothetical protein PR003_g30459 [Phytophthora rubi]|uniref:RxLR effector protein n=1 Tax=Phytophthora rubi TaxID=129364 RepID=A0A6A4BE02_9STRA|nr:hypothetical protein PR001_g29670 [Phytophthora rubi]KAE8963454.1 hypothetical protein PR002_g29286 [Phytophthora rubi]KAE9271608.1 hypothetical protein PR003_g30459 [Phytophthora rubi]
MRTRLSFVVLAVLDFILGRCAPCIPNSDLGCFAVSWIPSNITGELVSRNKPSV